MAEGRWRTFARINSDSGHACSSALHAEALGSTYDAVWRYFFTYVKSAAHGGDESWLMDSRGGMDAAELELSHDMSLWWTSLNSGLDPNAAPYRGAPAWPKFNPALSPGTMFLGSADGALPVASVNSTTDTVRAECEHWKQFLGW